MHSVRKHSLRCWHCAYSLSARNRQSPTMTWKAYQQLWKCKSHIVMCVKGSLHAAEWHTWHLGFSHRKQGSTSASWLGSSNRPLDCLMLYANDPGPWCSAECADCFAACRRASAGGGVQGQQLLQQRHCSRPGPPLPAPPIPASSVSRSQQCTVWAAGPN